MVCWNNCKGLYEFKFTSEIGEFLFRVIERTPFFGVCMLHIDRFNRDSSIFDRQLKEYDLKVKEKEIFKNLQSKIYYLLRRPKGIS